MNDYTHIIIGLPIMYLIVVVAMVVVIGAMLYAAEALNVTEAHKAAIMNMDNIEDIQEYDITDGYPEKLDLSVEFLTK